MERLRRFPARAAIEVRVHHVAHDRAGADDGDFDYEVVEVLRLQARQRRHLRAAFHLEHADGVALLERLVDGGIVLRELAEIDLFVPVIADELEAVFENGHHAEPEEIDFHNAEVGAVFLVPLHDDAARHRCGFERHDVVEAPLGHDHAAGVLAEMAREILQRDYDVEKFADLQVVEIETGFAELFFLRVFLVVIAPHGGERRKPCRAWSHRSRGLCRLRARRGVRDT